MRALSQQDWNPYKRRKSYQECVFPEQRACEDTARRRPFGSLERKLPQQPSLLVLWSWSCSLPNCEKINFCCWSRQSVVFSYDSPGWLIHPAPKSPISHHLVQHKINLFNWLYLALSTCPSLSPAVFPTKFHPHSLIFLWYSEFVGGKNRYLKFVWLELSFPVSFQEWLLLFLDISAQMAFHQKGYVWSFHGE